MASWKGLHIFLIVTLYVGSIETSKTSKYDIMKNRQQDRKLSDASVLNSFFGISIEECADECIARQRCLSISYHVDAHVCFLGNSSPSGLVHTRGYIYSEVKDWSTTRNPQCVTKCKPNETCNVHGNTCTCKVKECGPPPPKPGTSIFGNIHSIGAVVKYVCTADPCAMITSRCQSNGTWSGLNATVCKTGMPVLEGKTFHITCPFTSKWWHADVSRNGAINTQWSQGLQADGFTKFMFIKEHTSDNKFLIKNEMANGFVADKGVYLSADPGNKMETYSLTHHCDGFRMFNEDTQRFVHVTQTGNKYVTTQGNLTDDTSIFRFDEI